LNSNDSIKFAIIGLGNIGQRHATHILAHPSAQLAATIDIDLTKKIDGIPSFKSLEDCINLGIDLDVVNVCSPNFLHETHTIGALNNGYNVVCEKPMALSEQECDAMIIAAEKANRTIFVVKQNRYNPPVQAVKDLLNKNNLGKIFFVNINCFWNRNVHYYAGSDWRGMKNKDGGILFTQFSHFVDILYYLFGEMETIHSIMHNFAHPDIEIEDNGSSIMTSKNGAIVNFNYSTCAFEKNMEGAITIIAEKGTVKIGGQYLNTIEYQNVAEITLPPIVIEAKSNDYGQYQGSMSNHDKVIQNVIDTLQGKAEVMTNAYEGKAVVKIIESMYRGVK
jgi:UDP-N-acetyl-2-amino-2-deoxyglucuronate dehydrogenase